MAAQTVKTARPRARKRPKGAPVHVVTTSLHCGTRLLKIADVRLFAAHRVYNACLSAALRRAEACKADPDWEKARKMPGGKQKTKAAMAKNLAFAAVRARHSLSETALMSYGSRLRKAWVREHVGAQEAQALARRAYSAADRWVKGTGGRPRFKTARRPLRSIDTKDACGDMKPIFDAAGRLTHLRWAGEDFPVEKVRRDAKSKRAREATAERERLEQAIKDGRLINVRLVKRVISGRVSLQAQWVLDGNPPVRRPVGDGLVSLDMGPSTAHVVTRSPDGSPVPEATGHFELAPSVEFRSKELRRLQRRLDRQHRAGSPLCFDDAKRHVEGRCHWKDRSRAAQTTRARIAEVYRRMAGARSTEHGRLINWLLGYGAQWVAEDIDYVSWQKNFPRSVRDRAPGLFVAKAVRKAENAGGGFRRYSTRLTAASQTCICGRRERKQLSQRRHSCPSCGRDAQRDLFSAYIGSYAYMGEDGLDRLDLEGAGRAWPAFAPHLQEAAGSARSATASAKHRGRVRSKRSTARITARRHRRFAGKATEVLADANQSASSAEAEA